MQRETKYPHKDLRDEFAMAALTGILANPNYDNTFQKDAENAFKQADAMLKARSDQDKSE